MKLCKTTLHTCNLSGNQTRSGKGFIPGHCTPFAVFPHSRGKQLPFQTRNSPFAKLAAFDVSVHRKCTPRLNISTNWQEARRRRRGFLEQSPTLPSPASFPISSRTPVSLEASRPLIILAASYLDLT